MLVMIGGGKVASSGKLFWRIRTIEAQINAIDERAKDVISLSSEPADFDPDSVRRGSTATFHIPKLN